MNEEDIMVSGNAHVSYRLTVQLWEKDEDFNELLQTIEATGMATEFAFFSNNNHTPPPMDIMRARFAILKRRVAAMHERGWKAGINHLCTLGHTYENVRHAATGGQLMVYSSGKPCPGNFCPADPVWRENYIRECYTLAAECHPDFIWIDDDLRLANHGGVYDFGCFCPSCFPRLSAFIGYHGELADLPDFFECHDIAERRKRRAALLEWNARVTADIAGYIERIVHAVDPSIILGQMDGWQPIGGFDFAGHAAALSGSGHCPVWWRPGGGFYFDRCPDEILDKANSIGREAAMLPKSVEVIQAEVESFNYQRLNKSSFMTALEPQIYCAAGATGAAYNVFGEREWDDFDVNQSLIRALNGNRNFLNRIVSGNQRISPQGIFDGTGRMIHLSHRGQDGKWLTLQGNDDTSFLNSELQKIGLPPAYTAADACLYAVTGQTVESMSDEEILAMLKKGAYLDGFALQVLNLRGYGDFTGFTVREIIEEDAIEEFLNHPLNGKAIGKRRNGRQSFWYQPAFSLVPCGNAQILSRCVDYCGQELGKCLSGVYINSLGGRIAVEGYYPWGTMFYRSQSARVKQLFRWLSREKLPGCLASYHRAALWIRPDNAFIWNMSQDPLQDGALLLKHESPVLIAYSQAGKEMTLRAAETDNGYQIFALPEIAPWTALYCESQVIN